MISEKFFVIWYFFPGFLEDDLIDDFVWFLDDLIEGECRNLNHSDFDYWELFNPFFNFQVS
jgi:hypothetical protein